MQKLQKSYLELLSCDSSAAQVFPRVVMRTPDMLTNTATTLAIFNESSPRSTPMKRVKSPEVEDKTVVLATLVRAKAAFERYYRKINFHVINLALQNWSREQMRCISNRISYQKKPIFYPKLATYKL